MQKALKVLILSLISFTALVFVIFSIFSSSLPEVLGLLPANVKTSGGSLQRYSDLYESYEIYDTVKSINISSSEFTINVYSTEEEFIFITISQTDRSSEMPEYTVNCTDGTLSLELPEKSYGGVVELYLPASVKFSSLNIQNIYSPVNLYSVSVSDITIKSIFGDVYASGTRNVRSFNVTTLKGQIIISDCTITSLECESDSGEIIIESGTENLKAKSSTGKIQFVSDLFFKKADLRTESGDIELIFLPDSSFEISYFNKYGSIIYKDFFLTAEGNILYCSSENSVPVPVSIETDYGNVYIYSSIR